MKPPEPPTNVRVVIDDVEHPVELFYDGIDENGCHRWVATGTWRGAPVTIRADTLPPFTSISVAIGPPDTQQNSP